jgi:hypothetical protein
MNSRRSIGWAAAIAAVAFAGSAIAGPVGMGLHHTEAHSRAVAKAREQAKAGGEQTTAARVDERKGQRVCVQSGPPHRPNTGATCVTR